MALSTDPEEPVWVQGQRWGGCPRQEPLRTWLDELSPGPGVAEPGWGGGEQGQGRRRTWPRAVGWMSSAMVTLPCCSRRFTSLEQQMFTELSTCQRLYSTKERLSMTSGPPGPPRSRLASFLASITFLGSRSPAMVSSGQWVPLK